MPLSDMDIAAGLRSQVYRLVKLLRKETRNDERLSLTERSTLSLINDYGEILPGELASMEKVSTQAISQVLSHLQAEGLIRRTPSKEDGRKVLITLSEEGRKLVRRRVNEKQEWLTRSIGQKLNAREKQILADATDILTKLIG
jgi:DNA-binding MarR family transcriptional regulator